MAIDSSSSTIRMAARGALASERGSPNGELLPTCGLQLSRTAAGAPQASGGHQGDVRVASAKRRGQAGPMPGVAHPHRHAETWSAAFLDHDPTLDLLQRHGPPDSD